LVSYSVANADKDLLKPDPKWMSFWKWGRHLILTDFPERGYFEPSSKKASVKFKPVASTRADVLDMKNVRALRTVYVVGAEVKVNSVPAREGTNA
jgi:hypothetical protein